MTRGLRTQWTEHSGSETAVSTPLAVTSAVKTTDAINEAFGQASEQDFFGGDDGTRTHDFLLAKQVL